MLTILGTIAIVLATVIAGVLVDRRWPLIPRKDKLLAAGPGLHLPPHAPGEAPASAIDVTPAELAKLVRARCRACKGDTDVRVDDTVTYDGRELRVLHARCRRCGVARSTYVFVRS